MARRKNKILVPEAREGLEHLKARVMKEQGYTVNTSKPDEVKYEIANELGIPFNKGYNGKLTSEEAGKIGGPIGGQMVKELIKMAQQQMTKNNNY
ncbi:MAG: small, acid-soluble spore protein, alpha/beta type [Paenisporosarcina sp.]